MSASAPRSAPSGSGAGESTASGVGEAHNATQPADDARANMESLADFCDGFIPGFGEAVRYAFGEVLTKAPTWGLWAIAANSGAADELEFYGGTL